MIFVVAVAILLAFTAHNLVAREKIKDPPVDLWKHDPVTRRKIVREILSKHMAKEDTEHPGTPSNWSLDHFIDKYMVHINVQYRSPDNWTINNLLENNEDALFRPYVFGDILKKHGIDLEDKENQTDYAWTFKDFVEKYQPTAVLDEVKEQLNDQNMTKAKLVSIVNSLDSTDELLSLSVPGQKSGRRWRVGWLHPQPVQDKIKATENLQNILLFMKQAIYEARERMTLMQAIREDYRSSSIYKMGYLFAKTDYACKIFSSLSFKSFRTCSMIRQKPFGKYRLFYHYMDIAYNIERLEARWFDVDILKDILTSNDLIARKVILKDRNLTTPAMVLHAFDEMFID